MPTTPVRGSTELVAHRRQEIALGARGDFGIVFRLSQLLFRPFAVGRVG